ncbi:hypothetical protein ACFS07_04545 [Undibacterium arcticum]
MAPSLPQSIKGVIVNIKAIKLIKTCALFVAVGLGGCGGSGGEPTNVLAANCASGVAAPSSCTAITPATAAIAATLFTTAPSAVTMTSGGSATYTVGGGTAPYTATSGNTSAVTTTLAGTTLTINSIAATSILAGAVPIAIVDSTGKSVTINVTVLGIGAAGTPPSIFPASITTGDCTTNIPFIFFWWNCPIYHLHQ